MSEIHLLLQNVMIVSEGLATFIAVVMTFIRKSKGLYSYFAGYLVFIFCCEAFGKYGVKYSPFPMHLFFNYFVIPLEFIFFFWLYAYVSLKKKVLFWIFTAVFLLAYIPNELYFLKNKYIFSFNYTFGSVLLMFLVVLEYYKQVNSDRILEFAKNPMFYTNLGVTLFYIGTLPYWTFYLQIHEHKQIWGIYTLYFQASAVIMYLMFASSFIWGKQNYS